jgi:hypothetical protein
MIQLESKLINVELQLKNVLAWQFDIATAATRRLPVSPAYSPKLPALSASYPPLTPKTELTDDLTYSELVTQSTQPISAQQETVGRSNGEEAVDEHVDSTIQEDNFALASEISRE